MKTRLTGLSALALVAWALYAQAGTATGLNPLSAAAEEARVGQFTCVTNATAPGSTTCYQQVVKGPMDQYPWFRCDGAVPYKDCVSSNVQTNSKCTRFNEQCGGGMEKQAAQGGAWAADGDCNLFFSTGAQAKALGQGETCIATTSPPTSQ
jgi:hypothetical protein